MLRLIPVLLLMPENEMENVHAWYKIDVNTCAARSDSHVVTVDFYRSVKAFWLEWILLPEEDWP